MWLLRWVTISSPWFVCDFIAMLFDMVPEGTKRAASFPSIPATISWSCITVGSAPQTSSPTAASDMASLIGGVGWVTVSLRRSTRSPG